VILRYPNVYGERQDPYGEAGVAAIFSRQMLNSEEVVINGDGDQSRDFVYVADIAEANRLAISNLQFPISNLPVFNLGSGSETSVNQLFQMLAKLTGYSRKPRHGPVIPGEVYKIYLDTRRAEKALGWQPKTDLEEGLRRMIGGLVD
jgi:UDP-glucose 4-epimerase